GFEGLARCLDRAVDVNGARFGYLRDHFFARGIIDRESLSGGGRFPPSVDEILVRANSGCCTAGHGCLPLPKNPKITALPTSEGSCAPNTQKKKTPPLR